MLRLVGSAAVRADHGERPQTMVCTKRALRYSREAGNRIHAAFFPLNALFDLVLLIKNLIISISLFFFEIFSD